MKNKLELYQKVIVILGYVVFASKYPFVAAFMVLFYKDDFIRMHMNRIILCGFLKTTIYLLELKNIVIPYFSCDTFIFLFCVMGIIQAVLSSKHQLLVIDKIYLVRYWEGISINKYLMFGITLVIIVLSCFVRC